MLNRCSSMSFVVFTEHVGEQFLKSFLCLLVFPNWKDSPGNEVEVDGDAYFKHVGFKHELSIRFRKCFQNWFI